MPVMFQEGFMTKPTLSKSLDKNTSKKLVLFFVSQCIVIIPLESVIIHLVWVDGWNKNHFLQLDIEKILLRRVAVFIISL